MQPQLLRSGFFVLCTLLMVACEDEKKIFDFQSISFMILISIIIISILLTVTRNLFFFSFSFGFLWTRKYAITNAFKRIIIIIITIIVEQDKNNSHKIVLAKCLNFPARARTSKIFFLSLLTFQKFYKNIRFGRSNGVF